MQQSVLMSAVAILGILYPVNPRSLYSLFCGGALLLVSAVCGIAGSKALGRNLTPLPKPSTDAQLVQHGIYGWIRHPLYTSVTCAALGWSLVRQSWPALVVSLGLAVFCDAKARREEQWLRQQFPEYAGYEASRWRLIPYIW